MTRTVSASPAVVLMFHVSRKMIIRCHGANHLIRKYTRTHHLVPSNLEPLLCFPFSRPHHRSPVCLLPLPSTQDHRGSIAWVSEAFGAQWGFIDAVWSLATSFLDNALFPLIIADFLGLTGTPRWAFVYTCIAGLTWAVYRGSAVREPSCVPEDGH